MKNDLVSIIIPAYKAEKYIERCLASIINQTHTNLEIVIVDDGSPDKTPEMLDAYAKKDKRIKVIHKTNSGVSSARNEGIKKATGKYVCFVDIDDEVKPDYVKCMYEAITKHNTDAAMCSLISERKKDIFTIEGSETIKVFTFPENLDDFVEVYCSGVFMPPYCKLYKTEMIKEGFPENTSFGEDEIFNLKYFCNVKSMVVVPNPQYIYYLNDASLSHKDGLSLINQRINNLQTRYLLLSKLFGENSKNANYITSRFIIRHIFGVIEEKIKSKTKTKEIINILKELTNNKEVQFALSIYPEIDKKTTLIWKCLVKKQFRKLVLLRKIKMMFSK